MLGTWLPEGVENRGTGNKALEYYRVELTGVDDKLLGKLIALDECKAAAWNKAQKALDIHSFGRILHALQVFGAKTGRWSSKGVQVQNMPRPKYSAKIWEKSYGAFAEAALLGKITYKDKDMIATCIRPLLLPDEGDEFLSSDLSQIEPRIAFHLAGDMKSLQTLHKEDLYLDFAKDVFGPKVKKADEERYIAKQAVLSVIYGTGARALREKILSDSGLNITKVKAKKVRNKFTDKFPLIVKQWDKYDLMLKKALPSRVLRIKIRSGKILEYRNLKKKLVPKIGEDGGAYKSWEYTYNNGYGDTPIYGAKIFNNVVQAEATDLFTIKLIHFLINVPEAKLRFSVHDEVVCSVEKGIDKKVIEMGWNKAGHEKIQDIWPDIVLGSDFKWLDYYYK